jgi:hypothetical protein
MTNGLPSASITGNQPLSRPRLTPMNIEIKHRETNGSMTARVKAGLDRTRLVWVCLLPLLLLAAGSSACAARHFRPATSQHKSGVAEYREVVVFAITAIKATLDSMDQLTIQPDTRSFKAFAESVHRLEVDSIEVRARTRAMEARGEAYFAQWQEQLTRMNDDGARQRAEEHREELKRSFDQILLSVRVTRQSFEFFLAGLHRLRARLEPNPDLASVNATRALLASTESSGHEVQEGLADILAELNSIAVQLAPPKANEPKQP